MEGGDWPGIRHQMRIHRELIRSRPPVLVTGLSVPAEATVGIHAEPAEESP